MVLAAVTMEARRLLGANYTVRSPADTEAQLTGFSELAATAIAIANAQARVELRGFADDQAGAATGGDAGGPAGERRQLRCSPRSPRKRGGCWGPITRR
jgi:hypothetical protein